MHNCIWSYSYAGFDNLLMNRSELYWQLIELIQIKLLNEPVVQIQEILAQGVVILLELEIHLLEQLGILAILKMEETMILRVVSIQKKIMIHI